MADEDDDEVMPVVINVYTSFFKRDLQIYALGDIRFQKPKSIKAVGYALLLMFIWSGPMFMLIGPEKVISNAFFAAVTFAPPILLGMVMSRPIFHNKPLVKDLVSIIKYMGQASLYTDLVSYDYPDEMSDEYEIWLADWDCYGQEEEELDEIDGGYASSRKKKRSKRVHDTIHREKKPRDKKVRKKRVVEKQQPDVDDDGIEIPRAIPLNDSGRRALAQAQKAARSGDLQYQR